MSHRYTALLTHLVFSTKNRFPHLVGDLASDCHAYLVGIVKNMGGYAIEVGGFVDHVHLLLDLSPTHSLSEVVRTLKSNSSKWIHEGRRDSKFAWQKGYSAFSVSKSAVDRVRRYIARQESHHRGKSYQDEVRELLRRHGMTWDERYIWE